MGSKDPEYYARRLVQERAQAARTLDPYAKRLHGDLAKRYAALAGEEPDLIQTRIPA